MIHNTTMKLSSLPLLVVGILIISSVFSASTVIPQSGLYPYVIPSRVESSADDVTTALIRFPATSVDSWLLADVEVVGSSPGWIDAIVPQNRLPLLTASGVDICVILDDVTRYSQTVAGDYHSLAEMEQLLQDIATTYPDITRLYSIGTSYENRQIWCLEISDNPGVDEGEPGVFFMGLHHAREWPTVEICLYIAQTLTSFSAIDPAVRDLIDNRRIWIVTCVNPDGYYYSHDQGNDWRKNRHYFPETDTYGVDLNRNYPGSCNGDSWGAWGSLGEGSITHNPSSSVYCGPQPFSERETQAVRDLFLEHNITATISFHTYGELVLWPWGYHGDVQVPNDDYISQIGRDMAARMTTQSGTDTYTPVQAAGLYPTTGDTSDWAYGAAHYVQGTTTFSYTIEACQEFQPPADALDQIVQENYDAALLLLQEAQNISSVPSRVLPPRLDDMSTDPDGAYTVFWKQRNPDATAMHFQIDELTDLDYIIDHAETENDYWTFAGFMQDTSRAHSASFSYATENEDEQVYAMTTMHPIPVVAGQQLTFWCWYDIEENWDYAMVEMSRDGRCYELLDTFTGDSDGWKYHSYDLSYYVDESVFLRFRYTTDGRTTGAGFFVDDISPIADFSSVTTLASDISSSYVDIANRDDGMYYYRVRGYNEAYGWGDFSTLKSIQVTPDDNTPPETPSIDGPSRGNTGEQYIYEFITADSEDNEVYFYIDWGDGTDSGWLGPYASEDMVSVEHVWAEDGSYDVKAKAKDDKGIQSPWGTLQVSMPLARHSLLEHIIYWFLTMLSLMPHR